jgi:thiol-disulfide isomerase/thioredoxin
MQQNKTNPTPNRSGRCAAAAVVIALMTFIQTSRSEVKVGDSFPDVSSGQLQGKAPALSGKIVLVDFWASWCGPCKKSFPAMNALQKKYADKGLVIVAINVDDQSANMDSFLKKTPANFAVLWDSHQTFVNKVDVHTMPTSFLLDKDGKVRFVHSGFLGAETERQYEAEIESLLKN